MYFVGSLDDTSLYTYTISNDRAGYILALSQNEMCRTTPTIPGTSTLTLTSYTGQSFYSFAHDTMESLKTNTDYYFEAPTTIQSGNAQMGGMISQVCSVATYAAPALTFVLPTDASSTYYVYNTNQKYQFSPFRISQTCDDYSVSIQATLQSGPGAPNWPSFVQLDSMSSVFSFYTSDTSTVGTYLFRVQGVLPSGQISNGISYTLTVQNPCSAATLTTSAIFTDYSYYVGDSMQMFNNFSSSHWTLNPSYCGSVTFSATCQGVSLSSNYTTGLGSGGYISFYKQDSSFPLANPNENGFYVRTTSTTAKGNYTMTITGTSVNGVVVGPTSFILSIRGCDEAPISVPTLSNLTYIIGDPAATLSFSTFNISNSFCLPFTYTAFWNNSNAMTYSFPSSGSVSLNSGSKTFSISSSNILLPNLIGVTTLVNLTGTASLASSYTYFYVTLVNPCQTDFVTTQLISDQTYSIGTGYASIPSTAFSNWAQTYSAVCGSFFYNATANGTLIGSSGAPFNLPGTGDLSFSSTNKQFQATTNNMDLIDSFYNITVYGTASGSYGARSFILRFINPCPSVTLTPSSLSNQTYFIGSASATFSFPDFTISNQMCKSITYTPTVGGVAVPYNFPNSAGSIAFNNMTKTFTVSNNDPSQAPSSLLILVTGTSRDSVSNSLAFYLNLVTPCILSSITTHTPQNQSVYINGTNITFQFSDWLVNNNALCTPFAYNASIEDNQPLPISNIFGAVTLESATRTFSIQLNSILLANAVFYIKLTGNATGAVSTTIFFVTAINQCPRDFVTTTAIGDISYGIGTGQAGWPSVAFTNWTQSLSSICGDFTYNSTANGTLIGDFVTPFNLPGNGAISFSSDLRQFSINTNNMDLANTFYNVTVYGSASGSYGARSFRIRLINNCSSEYITPISLPNQTFYIGEGAMTFNFSDFSISNQMCKSINYSASVVGGSSFPLTFPSTSDTVTFSNLTKQFSVSAMSDLSQSGTEYQIMVTATGNSGIQASSSFYLKLQSPCYKATRGVFTPADQQVPISNLAKTFTFADWTSSISICYPFQYSAFTYGSLLPYSFPINGSITFNSTTKVFSVQSNNMALIGNSYLVTLYGNAQEAANSTNFTVNFTNPCLTALLTPPTISNIAYPVGMGIQNFSFSDWSLSNSLCAPITYSASILDVSSPYSLQVGGYISLDPNAKTIQVLSSNFSYIGQTLTVNLTASTGYQLSNSTFVNVTFFDPCTVTSYTPSTLDTTSGALQKVIYSVTASVSTSFFRNFTQSPNCNVVDTYTYSVVDKTGITLSGAAAAAFLTPDFTTSPKQIKIYSTDTSLVLKSPYVVTITGTLINRSGTTLTTSVLLPLVIQGLNNGPPYFKPALGTVEATAGQAAVTFSLTGDTSIEDDDSTDKGSVLSLSTNGKTWITYSSPILKIAPDSTVAAGSYNVKITLIDNNISPLQQTYTLTVKVTSNSTSANSTNSTSNSSSSSSAADDTLSQYFITETTALFNGMIIRNVIKGDKVSKNLEAIITRISNKGEVTVFFNKAMMVPANYTSFNESILHCFIDLNNGDQASEFNFTWKITKFEQNFMYFQLNFTNPSSISANDKNKFNIQFLANGFFLEKQNGNAIKFLTVINREMPRMMPNDAATLMLVSAGGTAGGTMQSAMMGSMALNIVLSASLQQLWGMINVLQIIIHMPLYNLYFPANAMMFYGLIMNIANFNVIPADWVSNDLFTFSQNSAFNYGAEEMGYNYSNLIQNLGPMFIYLMVMIFFILLAITLNLLSNFCARIKRVSRGVQNFVFYGLIIRFFLESYLELVISTLINFKDAQFTLFADKLNFVLTVVLFIIVTVLPIMLVWFFVKCRKNMHKKTFETKYGVFWEGLDETRTSPLAFNLIFMMRRYMYSLYIILLPDMPAAQIQLLMLQCIFIMIYIAYCKPFKIKMMNRLEIFNEFTILACCYHLLTYTDWTPDIKFQYQSGWSIIGITCFNVFVNLGLMLIGTFKQLRLAYLRKFKPWIKKKCAKSKKAKPVNLNESMRPMNLRYQINFDAGPESPGKSPEQPAVTQSSPSRIRKFSFTSRIQYQRDQSNILYPDQTSGPLEPNLPDQLVDISYPTVFTNRQPEGLRPPSLMEAPEQFTFKINKPKNLRNRRNTDFYKRQHLGDPTNLESK